MNFGKRGRGEKGKEKGNDDASGGILRNLERSKGSYSIAFLLFWRSSRQLVCIIMDMNKRAKKRLKEAIEKENLERAKIRNEQNPSSAKQYQENRGFTPKPEKKRG